MDTVATVSKKKKNIPLSILTSWYYSIFNYISNISIILPFLLCWTYNFPGIRNYYETHSK